jgi:hypothetical protein
MKFAACCGFSVICVKDLSKGIIMLHVRPLETYQNELSGGEMNWLYILNVTEISKNRVSCNILKELDTLADQGRHGLEITKGQTPIPWSCNIREKDIKLFYIILFFVVFNIREPFAKFMDSPYYSESELCGGAVTVSFSKYLPWQEMHFLQRSTHVSKTFCRPLIT